MKKLSHRKMLLALVGVLAVSSACGEVKITPPGAPGAAPTAPPDAINAVTIDDKPSADQIVFMARDLERGSGSANELYRINSNGSGLTRLTNNNTNESYPTWSADGNKVVYVCHGTAICTANPDGSKEELIYTHKPPSATAVAIDSPVLSPDGTKLAFESGQRDNMVGDVYIYEIATKKLTNFTDSPDFIDISPQWHPLGGLAWVRGNQVLYAPGGTDEVFVIADGAGLFNNPDDLDVSPNGEKFAFVANPVGSVPNEIYVADAVQDTVKQITISTNVPDYGPAWSPDGTKIAFSRPDSSAVKNRSIMVMNEDGSGLHSVTFTETSNHDPDWAVPTSTVSIDDVEANEGTPTTPGTTGTTDFRFTAKLSTPATSTVSVPYSVSGISAKIPEDLAAKSGTLTFAAGEKSRTIDISVVSDDVPEGNDSFKVVLGAPTGAVLGDGEGRGLILNDDVAPTPTPTPTATAPAGDPTGNIAYSRGAVGGSDYDIWLMNAQGENPMALTTGSAVDATPDLNAAGTQVLFNRSSAGPPDIYVVPATGGSATKVNGTSDAADVTPSWSPSGGAMVWAVNGSDGTVSLKTATPPSGTPTLLLDDTGYESYPEWGVLANGNEAVAYDVQSDSGTFTAKLRNLTTGTTTDFGSGRQPEISPDGTKLVFASDRDDGELDVYVVDLTVSGATPVRLTTATGHDATPTWSPDGQYIAFTSHRDGDAEIYRMTATGGSQTNLSNSASTDDFEPTWEIDPAAPTSAEASPAPSSSSSPAKPSRKGPWRTGIVAPFAGGSLLLLLRKLRKHS